MQWIPNFATLSGIFELNRLSEVVSELYLCTDQRRAEKLWKSVRTALTNAGVHEGRVERLVSSRDVERLAGLIGDLF